MVSIIIKTHNDFKVLDRCIDCVMQQTEKEYRVIIVDTASSSTDYVEKYIGYPKIDVIIDSRDLGFCVGNNIAARKVLDSSQYIFFLNPDAFLSADFLSLSVKLMNSPSMQNVGAISGKMLRYDLANSKATNIIDSTGIFQSWYGKWYDRGQSSVDVGQYDSLSGEDVPAVCGALMFCRTDALIASQLKQGEYFRESFFMYKDDIDLSIRIRSAGYRIKYFSTLLAWHCRGWQKRSRMSKNAKLFSARNEIVINRELSLIKYSYSLTKLALVKLGL